jgi:hypothetical protein
MVDVKTIGVLVTAASVSIAAIYCMFNMRATLQTRQAQLFMQSFNIWLSLGYADKLAKLLFNQHLSDFNDWKEKYGPENNPRGASVYFSLDTYFEGSGTQVKKKLIDPEFNDELMASDLIAYWSKIRPVAEGIRRMKGYEMWGKNSEYLYDEVSKIYRMQHSDTGVIYNSIALS